MAEAIAAEGAADGRDKVPEAELCEFVNTDTGKRCQSRAKWKCSASSVVSNVRTCERHARPFRGKSGCSVRAIDQGS